MDFYLQFKNWQNFEIFRPAQIDSLSLYVQISCIHLYHTFKLERSSGFDTINWYICHKMFCVHIINNCVKFLLANERSINHNHCCGWLKIKFKVYLEWCKVVSFNYIKGESNICDVFSPRIFENSARETTAIRYVPTFIINQHIIFSSVPNCILGERFYFRWNRIFFINKS